MGRNFYVMGFHNQREFRSDKFNENDRIENKASLHASLTDFTVPVFTETWIESNELIDETAMIQIG